MSVVLRVLICLNVVVAAVALLATSALYQHRHQLRERGDALAATVVDLAAALHQYNPEVTADLEGEDLVWRAFAEGPNACRARLQQLQSDLAAVLAQRDQLAALVAESAAVHSVGAAMVDADFRDLTRFADSAADYRGGLVAVKAERQAIRDGVLAVGQALRGPEVDVTPEDVDDLGAALIELAGTAVAQRQRCEHYASTLSRLPRLLRDAELQVDSAALADPVRYPEELAGLQNALARLNDRLHAARGLSRELLEFRALLEKRTTNLEAAQFALATLETELESCQTHLWEAQADDPDQADQPMLRSKFDPNLTGRIVRVNHEWGYVIIDVGRRDHLPEWQTMTVARDAEFICRLKIKRVLADHAVADIVPEMCQGQVSPGDRVIF